LNRLDKTKSFLNRIALLFKNKHLLGVDLINASDDQEVIDTVHYNALRLMVKGDHQGFSTNQKYLVFTSLALIGYMHYSGNFWDHVHEVYESVMDDYSLKRYDRKVTNIVKTLVSDYYSGPAIQQRKINWILMQCVVPSYYLPIYFDLMLEVFVYDLRTSLPDSDKELDDVLFAIISQISKKHTSDTDDFQSKIMNQSYRLIQSTLDAMSSRLYRPSVIRFSREILKRLAKMLVVDQTPYSKPDVLHTMMNEWMRERGDRKYKDLDRYAKQHTRRTPIQWSPSLCLVDTFLHVKTKTIFLSEDVDHTKVAIQLYDGDNIIYENGRPEIISDDGISMELSSLSIPLKGSPFNLKLRINGTGIDDHVFDQPVLYFDESGKQIKTLSERLTEVFIVSKDLSDSNVTFLFNRGYYQIGLFKPGDNDFLRVGDHVVSLKKHDEVKIVTPEHSGAYVCYQDAVIEVFKGDVYIIVPNQDVYTNSKVWVNGRMMVSNMSFGEEPTYTFKLTCLENGLNEIKVTDDSGHPAGKPSLFRILLDNNLDTVIDRNDDSVKVSIKSSFVEEKEAEATFSLEEASHVCFNAMIGHLKADICVNPWIPMIKKENGSFKPITEDLWHEDFGYLENVTFRGINADSMEVTSNETVIRTVHADVCADGPSFKLDIGILKTEHRQHNAQISFLHEGMLVYSVDFLNHVVINPEEITIESDPGHPWVTIGIGEIRGRGSLLLVFKDDTESIDKVVIDKRDTTMIWNPPRIPMMVHVECHAEKGDRPFLIKSLYVYAHKDLIGRHFRIKELSLGVTKLPSHDYHIDSDKQWYTYILIDDYAHHEKKYSGKIYYLSKTAEKRMYHNVDRVCIQLIERIVSTSNIVADVLIHEDEEALLYDKSAHRILDLREEPKNATEVITIDEYILEMVES
jgi:hypothetical protein